MEISIKLNTEGEPDDKIDALILFLSKMKSSPEMEIESLDSDIDLVELSDDEVNEIICDMLDLAVSSPIGKAFKTTELYKEIVKKKGLRPWRDLSPNTRKAIGRRFRKLTDKHYSEADPDDAVIQFDTRNIQNMAIYKILNKTEVEN